MTREEMYLDAIAGGDGMIPEPITREEQYLNKIATGNGVIPENPITRKEMYLEQIVNSGTGGGHIVIEGDATYTDDGEGNITITEG